MVAWRTINFVSYVVFYERFSPSVDRTRPDSQNVHLTQMVYWTKLETVSRTGGGVRWGAMGGTFAKHIYTGK